MNQSQHPAKVLLSFLWLLLSLTFSPGQTGPDGRRPRAFVNLSCNLYKYWDPDLKASVTSTATSPEELDAAARRYAKERKLEFDFGASEARVFILRSSNYLGCVWYAPAKGQPALLCMFNFD